MQHHKDLQVWNKAMDLAEAVFVRTQEFPKSQLYVLTSQMQRSALSIPSNIAEGRGRNSVSEFSYFINVARGSVTELQTQLALAARLNYIGEQENTHFQTQADEILRMLHGLKQKLKPKAVGSRLSAVS